MSQERNNLSEHDQAVLDSIFNPIFNPGAVESFIDSNEELLDIEDHQEELTTEVQQSIKFELDGIKATENGDYESALEYFKKAIEIAPKRPAPRNNRAQTYRLLNNDEAALNDLHEAITLSNYKGRTGCRALCQRGLLKRKNKDDDGAREDFNMAAKLGSKFARTQLVQLNPYAALCNQMLRETFEKLAT